MCKKILSLVLALFFFFEGFGAVGKVFAIGIFKWDFPGERKPITTSSEFGKDINMDTEDSSVTLLAALPQNPYETQGAEMGGGASLESSEARRNLPVQYPAAEFDPILEPGMILVIEALDIQTKVVLSRATVPIMSDEVVSIPGLGVLEIVGKKLSIASQEIKKFSSQNFRIGLMMGSVQTVQVLGKVRKPDNYPGYLKTSALIASAGDRDVGSNFKIHFFNGANRTKRILRYEDVVKGNDDPLVPPGSKIYLMPSAGALFGEMTKEQVNLIYLIVITLGALGVTAIVR